MAITTASSPLTLPFAPHRPLLLLAISTLCCTTLVLGYQSSVLVGPNYHSTSMRPLQAHLNASNIVMGDTIAVASNSNQQWVVILQPPANRATQSHYPGMQAAHPEYKTLFKVPRPANTTGTWGASLAQSGTMVAVGSPALARQQQAISSGDSGSQPSVSGSVTLYDQSTEVPNTWLPIAPPITAPVGGVEAFTNFATVIDMAGDLLAVGGTAGSSSEIAAAVVYNITLLRAGVAADDAIVFQTTATMAEACLAGEATSSVSLALTPTYIVIGRSIFNDNSGGTGCAVQVNLPSYSALNQQIITPPAVSLCNHPAIPTTVHVSSSCGTRLAAEGDTIMVTDPGGGRDGSGIALVFQFERFDYSGSNDSTYVLLHFKQVIKPETRSDVDQFGATISLSGDVAAVGTNMAGLVFVLRRSATGQWSTQAQYFSGEYTTMPTPAITATNLLVAATGRNHPVALASATAFIATAPAKDLAVATIWPGATRSQVVTTATAVSGSTVFVGATRYIPSAGTSAPQHAVARYFVTPEGYLERDDTSVPLVQHMPADATPMGPNLASVAATGGLVAVGFTAPQPSMAGTVQVFLYNDNSLSYECHALVQSDAVEASTLFGAHVQLLPGAAASDPAILIVAVPDSIRPGEAHIVAMELPQTSDCSKVLTPTTAPHQQKLSCPQSDTCVGFAQTLQLGGTSLITSASGVVYDFPMVSRGVVAPPTWPPFAGQPIQSVQPLADSNAGFGSAVAVSPQGHILVACNRQQAKAYLFVRECQPDMPVLTCPFRQVDAKRANDGGTPHADGFCSSVAIHALDQSAKHSPFTPSVNITVGGATGAWNYHFMVSPNVTAPTMTPAAFLLRVATPQTPDASGAMYGAQVNVLPNGVILVGGRQGGMSMNLHDSFRALAGQVQGMALADRLAATDCVTGSAACMGACPTTPLEARPGGYTLSSSTLEDANMLGWSQKFPIFLRGPPGDTTSGSDDEVPTIHSLGQAVTSFYAANLRFRQPETEKLTVAPDGTTLGMAPFLVEDGGILAINGSLASDGTSPLLAGPSSVRNWGAGYTAAAFVNCHFVDGVAKRGGALAINSRRVVMNNVTIEKSSAALGGGIFPWGMAQVLMQNTVCSHNSATMQGGCLDTLAAEVIAANSTFEDNVAAVRGGAMSAGNYNLLVVLDCTFRRNTATSKDGGAIAVSQQAKVVVEGKTLFEGNNCTRYGGALMVTEAYAIVGPRVVFRHNVAGSAGGAIGCTTPESGVRASLILDGVLVVQNAAGSSAGGLNSHTCDISIRSTQGTPTTIAGNGLTNWQGGFHHPDSGVTDVVVTVPAGGANADVDVTIGGEGVTIGTHDKPAYSPTIEFSTLPLEAPDGVAASGDSLATECVQQHAAPGVARKCIEAPPRPGTKLLGGVNIGGTVVVTGRNITMSGPINYKRGTMAVALQLKRGVAPPTTLVSGEDMDSVMEVEAVDAYNNPAVTVYSQWKVKLTANSMVNTTLCRHYIVDDPERLHRCLDACHRNSTPTAVTSLSEAPFESRGDGFMSAVLQNVKLTATPGSFVLLALSVEPSEGVEVMHFVVEMAACEPGYQVSADGPGVCEPCPHGQYYPFATIERHVCKLCTSWDWAIGLECSGPNTVALDGYYWDHSHNQTLPSLMAKSYKFDSEHNLTIPVAVACDNPQRCQNNGRCMHNSRGPMCKECKKGFHERGSECVPNDGLDGPTKIMIVTGCSALLLFLLVFTQCCFNVCCGRFCGRCCCNACGNRCRCCGCRARARDEVGEDVNTCVQLIEKWSQWFVRWTRHRYPFIKIAFLQVSVRCGGFDWGFVQHLTTC